MTHAEILSTYTPQFDSLEMFFEGDSRVLKIVPGYEDVLLCRLVPSVFSFVEGGAVPLPGIDEPRAGLNALFCALLEEGGVKTCARATNGIVSLIDKHDVPPIEIVVKSAFVGSPKHVYKGLSNFPTRSGSRLMPGDRHEPYVRFDWRNSLPDEDMCMPIGLADQFIDTSVASVTAMKAFGILRDCLRAHDFELIDICFFMNTRGDTICAEVSTDNTGIVYTGNDPQVQQLFTRRDKPANLGKANALLSTLSSGVNL
jgi:phosphoribosylaminoimidazole-succinocarboxamide synthase